MDAEQAEDDNLFRPGRKNIRACTGLGCLFQESESLAGLENFDCIVGVPVAGGNNPSIGKNRGGYSAAFAVEDAGGSEGMCLRIEELDSPALPDSEIV